MAQVALRDGANDQHGTISKSRKAVFRMAGATAPQLQTERALVNAIREASRTPVQRHTF